MFRAAAIAVLLAVSAPAFAKEKGKDKPDPTIELVGLPSFDAVFAKVDAIDKRLTTAKKSLGDAKKDLNLALALEKGTSLQDGLAALKTKAAGQFTVTTTGGMPHLEPKGSVPADVADALDAVNGLVGGIATSITELQGIPAEAAGLVKAAAALPKQLKSEAKSAGLKPTEIPKVLKIVKQDVQVAAALPEKATAVVQRMTDLLSTIGSLAG